jgi:hypothetical protein
MAGGLTMIAIVVVGFIVVVGVLVLVGIGMATALKRKDGES